MCGPWWAPQACGARFCRICPQFCRGLEPKRSLWFNQVVPAALQAHARLTPGYARVLMRNPAEQSHGPRSFARGHEPRRTSGRVVARTRWIATPVCAQQLGQHARTSSESSWPGSDAWISTQTMPRSGFLATRGPRAGTVGHTRVNVANVCVCVCTLYFVLTASVRRRTSTASSQPAVTACRLR